MRGPLIGQPANCSSLGSVLNVLVWSQAAIGTLWLIAEHRARQAGKGGGSAMIPGGRGPEVTVTDPQAGERDAAEAHLKITDACGLPCADCHVDPSAGGAHVPAAEVLARLDRLVGAGVRRVALGGGEPLLHPELGAIVEGMAARGVTGGLTTSGVALRAEHLPILRRLALVSVSLDGLSEGFVESRGYDGAARALRAVGELAAAGVRAGINVVLTRRALAGLEETVAAAAGAGAREVQLLRLKPVGRARSFYEERRLTAEEGRGLWPRVEALIRRWPGILFRADCAMVPFIAAHGLDPGRMQAGWVRGCEGGVGVRSVGSGGEEQPCSFMPPSDDPRWRAAEPFAGVEPCGSCAWRAVCRGGCRAVSARVGEAFTPDPECPMVEERKRRHNTEPQSSTEGTEEIR